MNSINYAEEQFEEVKRQNKSMETNTLDKELYLGPYKKELGLFYIQQDQKTNEYNTSEALTNIDLVTYAKLFNIF